MLTVQFYLYHLNIVFDEYFQSIELAAINFNVFCDEKLSILTMQIK